MINLRHGHFLYRKLREQTRVSSTHSEERALAAKLEQERLKCGWQLAPFELLDVLFMREAIVSVANTRMYRGAVDFRLLIALPTPGNKDATRRRVRYVQPAGDVSQTQWP